MKILNKILNYKEIISILLITAISYFYDLQNIPLAWSSSEISIEKSFSTANFFFSNTLYFPYRLLNDVVYKLNLEKNLYFLRLPSALFVLIAVVLVYLIVLNWHGKRVAFLSSTMFLSSAWILHVGRLNSYQSIYLVIIPILILLKIKLGHSLKNNKIYLIAFINSLILFIPGVIWLDILMLYNSRKNLLFNLKKDKSIKHIILIVLFSFFWLPIVIYTIIQNNNLYLYLGLSISKLSYSFMNLIKPLKYIFISGPNSYLIWLPGTPIFNAFILALFVLGMFFYINHRGAGRSKFILFSLLISYLLIILGGTSYISIMVSLIYLVSFTGLADILQIWLKHFPYNKIARGFGIILLLIAIGLSCIYGYRSYFIAWHYNQNTQKIFANKTIN